jgi:hypothetical protein
MDQKPSAEALGYFLLTLFFLGNIRMVDLLMSINYQLSGINLL